MSSVEAAIDRVTTKPFWALRRGTSVHDVADRCRQAVLDLVEAGAAPLSEIDVELWLGAPYRGATSAFAAEVADGGESGDTGAPSHDAGLGARVREMLLSCAESRRPVCVAEVLEIGLVVGVRDELGSLGYVPLRATAGTPTIYKIASLLAADYLTRPCDYQHLQVCGDCQAISFAWSPCHDEITCVASRSGVVGREQVSSGRSAIFPPSGTDALFFKRGA